MNRQNLLAERTALVTGASQGLGRVIAQALAHAGCRVLVNYAHSRNNALRVVDEIVSAGGHAEECRADVSDEASVRELFARLAVGGAVDILVNNARLDPWRREPEISEGQWWDQVMVVNLKSAYLCSLCFLEQAKPKGWGRIVNVSSVRAFLPAEPTMVAYGVSKAGMHALTRSFAVQGAPFGITANTVAPGMIATENMDRRLTAERKAEELGRIPLARPATCEEVADAVLFAVCNGYVTGETININGGMFFGP